MANISIRAELEDAGWKANKIDWLAAQGVDLARPWPRGSEDARRLLTAVHRAWRDEKATTEKPTAAKWAAAARAAEQALANALRTSVSL